MARKSLEEDCIGVVRRRQDADKWRRDLPPAPDITGATFRP